MNIVVDTNVLISKVLSPKSSPAKVFEKLKKGLLTLLVSEEIILEYKRALLYPKVQKFHKFNEYEIDGIIKDICNAAVVIKPRYKPEIVSKDKDDNKFLWCARKGNAEYIISGDKHLLELAEFEGIYILRPVVFLKALENYI